MSIRNLIFGVNSITVSYLIRYDSLLQNATDVIRKCNSYFITKWTRSLLQNMTGFLLQNMIALLQNATILLQNVSYYKKQRLFQFATVHCDCVVCVCLYLCIYNVYMQRYTH